MFAKAFLFACTLTTVLSDDVVDRAMVLARKSVTSEFKQPVGAEELENVLVEGANFTVTVSLYNVGGQEAFEIEVEDEWEEDKFTLVDGSMRAAFSRLGPGDTVEYSFVLSPQFATPKKLYEYKPAVSSSFFKKNLFLFIFLLSFLSPSLAINALLLFFPSRNSSSNLYFFLHFFLQFFLHFILHFCLHSVRWLRTCMERRMSKLRLSPLHLAHTRRSQTNLFWMVKRTCCPRRITKLTLQCTIASGPRLLFLQLDQFCSRYSFGFRHQLSRGEDALHIGKTTQQKKKKQNEK